MGNVESTASPEDRQVPTRYRELPEPTRRDDLVLEHDTSAVSTSPGWDWVRQPDVLGAGGGNSGDDGD